MRMIKLFLLVSLFSLSIFSIIPVAYADLDPVYSVGVSVAPLAGIVDRVGGAYVETFILLPEGVEPHAAQLPTESVDAASNADLLVFTGHFSWEEDLANQVNVPFITMDDEQALANYADFGARYSPIPGHHETLSQDHVHEDDGNPHAWWLLPSNAIAIANTTRAAMSMLSENLSDYWNSMFDGFVNDVESFSDLVESMDESYSFSSMKAVVVFPAEAYVAEAFGIETVAYLQEGSVQISGQELLGVQEALRNRSVSLIFGSDVARLQAAGEFAYQLVEDYGGILIWWRVVFFEGLSDYLSVMTHNLGALTSGLEERTNGTVSNQTLNLGLIALSGILAVVVVIETVLLIQRSRIS
jgi:ABC-type Zn uptake system ZnuABC Zn-binding protein ZnuA